MRTASLDVVAKPSPNRGRIFGYGICSRLRDVFTEAGFTDKGADQFSAAGLERDPELGETTTWGSHLYLLHDVRIVTFLTAIEVRTCQFCCRQNESRRECSHGIGILEREAVETRPKHVRVGASRSPSPGVPGCPLGLGRDICAATHSNSRHQHSVRAGGGMTEHDSAGWVEIKRAAPESGPCNAFDPISNPCRPFHPCRLGALQEPFPSSASLPPSLRW